MSFVIDDKVYTVTKQLYRELYVKIFILNYNMLNTNEISGNCIGGNINIDANSDIRRTSKIDLIVTNSTFNVESGSDIWIDKYIQIFIGMKDIYTSEVLYQNCGIYLINKPNISYSAEGTVLSFEGIDLMSKLTGMRNGMLQSITTIIEAGSDLREAIKSTITQLGGFNNYIIECYDGNIPYDIKIDTGGTVYDVLVKLRDIYPNYEMFFDINGTFIFQKIPSDVSDPVMVNNDLWDSVVTNETIEINFEEVKNKIMVLGKSLDPQSFGGEATVSGSIYTITIANKTSVENNETIGFIAPSIVVSPQLCVKKDASTTLITGNIVDEGGNPAIISAVGEYYVVQKQSDGNFLLWGKQQPSYTASDTNIDSPFCVDNIGEIFEILHGGEYDNITTDKLCKERAEYELWKKTRLNDSIILNTVPVYWLDVNIKISYKDSFSGNTNQYIIKSISTDLSSSGVQTINAIKFYPLYPF